MVYVCTTAEYNRLLHSVYTIASRSVICTVPYQANSVVVILVCLITQVKQRLGRLVLEWVSIFTSLVRIQLNFILLWFCIGLHTSVQYSVQYSVQTSLQYSAQISIQYSVQTSVQYSVQTSEQTSVQYSVQTSVQTNVQYSVQTSVRTSVQTSVQYSVQTSVQTSVQYSV